MARSPNRKPYRQVPTGRIPIRAVFWLAALSLVLAIAGALAAHALGQATLTSSRVFQGTMSSQSQPVRIDLPEGAVVEDILVSNGDSVRRGQTLVSFDQSALQETIADLQSLDDKDHMILRCLTSDIATVPHPTSRPSSPEPQATACREFSLEEQRLEQSFAAQSEKNTQEIMLLDSYLAEASTLHRRQKNTAGENATLDRILALSLTKTTLENAQTVALAEHSAALQAIALRRSELLAATQDALHARQKKRSALSKLLETPRLHAPYSGKIIRLRHLPVGHVAKARAEILSLLPQREIGYVVQFPLADSDAQFLTVGDIVSLETIGLPALVDGLDAVITGIARSDQGALIAQANLTLQATKALAESPYSRQILANSSAVTVRIHKIPEQASSLIKDTLTKAVVIENTPALAAVVDGLSALRDWAVSQPKTVDAVQ